MNEKHNLSQLDDMIIEEILSMLEEDLRSEVDAGAVAAVRKDLDAASVLLGKADLAKAKAELAAYRSESGVLPFRAKAAVDLKAIRSADRTLDSKLTMAARNANGDQQADSEGIEQDLAELAAWKDRDSEEP
jgi:hypothetical protein